jgi:hypothetical protein
VRPRDTIFAGQELLPTWVATLYRELNGAGEQAPPHVLTPLAALDEVVVTATSLIEGRGDIPEADRLSLSRDVSMSLRNLGPAVQIACAAVLRAFQSSELQKLARLLTDVEGARRALSAARLLADELSLPRSAQGAWEDCVAAFEDPDATAGICELRTAQLREVCLRRGHSWDALAHRLSGLLADWRYAAVAVGAVADVDLDGADPNGPAGLPLERRLELCGDEVSAEPDRRESAVWLVYANADVPRGFLRVGPVQFFTHRLPLEAIRDGCPALNSPEFERPEELSDPFAKVHFSSLPKEPFVLARVKIRPSAIADIRTHARDLVSSLVEVASPQSEWVLLDGEAVFSDGGWWGTLGFDDPIESERARRAADPLYEGTAESLTSLHERFVNRLVEGDELAVAAVTERRWELAAGAAEDPAQRIALLIRTLERALPVSRGAGESLRDSCDHYLVDAWCFRQLHKELFDAAYSSLPRLRRQPDPGPTLYAELWQSVFPSTGELSFHLEPKVFMQRIPDVLAALPESTIERRMVSEAATVVDTASDALAHLDELTSRFRCLLARALRQRNAVVHGAATVPAVVDTCEPFIRQQCGYVVACTVGAVSNLEILLDRLERARAAWLRQRESLRVGNPPADVLFSGDLRGDRAYGA